MANKDVMVAEEFSACSQTSHMTIEVPANKRSISNTIVRSPKKRCQNSATAPATEVVKEIGSLDLTNNMDSSHLSFEVVSAQVSL